MTWVPHTNGRTPLTPAARSAAKFQTCACDPLPKLPKHEAAGWTVEVRPDDALDATREAGPRRAWSARSVKWHAKGRLVPLSP